MIGDDLRIQQILMNLVGNAIKFTIAGDISVLVDHRATDETFGKTTVHFSVTDTGIGVAPEKLEDIFNSFEQADNSYTRKYGGTGLGLAICRQLTTLMGGRIWAESRLDVGSSFHFTLDLEPCATSRLDNLAEDTHTPDAALQHLRILVVDDNEINRNMAVMMLEKDHQVATAGNGRQALEILRSQTFDIILMDVQMPEMDGLTTTRTIRALEQRRQVHADLSRDLVRDLNSRLRGGHLAIIAMTAHAMGNDREKCLAAGMDSYITKPFRPEQLKKFCTGLVTSSPAPGQPGEKKVQDTPADDDQGTTPLAKAIAYLQTSSRLTAAQSERVITAICKSINDNLGTATEALHQEDFEVLSRASHTLKGTLLQCGLHTLAEQAEEIYQFSTHRNRPPATRLLEQLKNGLADLVTANRQ
jgi:CheY-like chemotaxis protein